MSSLQLIIEAVQYNSTTIFVTSTTPQYDVTINPSGFGVLGYADIAPNIADIIDIGQTPGIIFLLKIAGVTYSYSDTAVIRALGWPNLTKTRLALTAANFGLSTFPDGKMELTAQVAGTHSFDGPDGLEVLGFTSSYTVVLYLTAMVECCVIKLAHAIRNTGKCFCEDDQVKLWREANTLLSILKNQVMAKEWTDADENLLQLQNLCISQKSNCNGCT